MFQDGSWQLGGSDDAASAIGAAWSEHRRYSESGALCSITFTTIADYLNLLRGIAEAVESVGLGARAMLYCAAAVSDFFLPASAQAEHKIQSDAASDGRLRLALPNTPKLLKWVRAAWAPHAFIVSFKLETDSDILLRKAARAIEAYGVHAVVANCLQTRYERVVLVTPRNSLSSASTDVASDAKLADAGKCSDSVHAEVVQRPAGASAELETALIARLADLHADFIASTRGATRA
jgi:phosphopantothenate-cysteine ligase